MTLKTHLYPHLFGLDRHVVFTLLALLAASCSSMPNQRENFADPKGLSICQGMKISNAPRTNNQGEIREFSATTVVRGVTLARAPVKGACVSSGFGHRKFGAGPLHKGVDLFTHSPRRVFAGGSGVISYAGTMRGYGRVVIIQHKRGVSTRYAHLSRIEDGVRPGKRIEAGQILGLTGRTGNATAIHLHYEIRVDDVAKDPLNLNAR